VARCVLAVLGLLALSSVAPLMAADNMIHLSVDASKTGPRIITGATESARETSDLPR